MISSRGFWLAYEESRLLGVLAASEVIVDYEVNGTEAAWGRNRFRR